MQKVAFGFQVSGFQFSLSFTRLGGHRPPLQIPATSYPSRATAFPQFCRVFVLPHSRHECTRALNFPLCSPCSLTRSLPLGSPFGPTFGCSISKTPPFRLWLMNLGRIDRPGASSCRPVADQSQSEADAVKSRPNGESHRQFFFRI